MLRSLLARLLSQPSIPPPAAGPGAGAAASVPDLDALADCHARAGRYLEAAACLERAAALAPGDLQVQVRLAQARQRCGAFAAAAAGLADAIAAERRRPAHDPRPLARAELVLGLAQLRSMTLDGAAAAFVRAYEADPSSDIPLQLAAYSRVMRFEWPANRTVLPASGTAMATARASGEVPVHVVYFYVATLAAPHSSGREVDYFELLRASAASARRRAPGARIVLLTDQATGVPDGAGIDEIHRFDVDPEQVMLARLAATAGYLAGAAAQVDAVLVDPSIYFAGDWRDAYRDDYDVGLVWRSDLWHTNQDIMPIYAGVTFVPSGRAARAARYFEQLCACLEALEADAAVREAYPGGLRRWWGDQLAPAALVGWRSFYAHVLIGATNRMQVDGIELGFFPAARYYAAPGDADGASIVKFKGRLKREMLAFAAARP